MNPGATRGDDQSLEAGEADRLLFIVPAPKTGVPILAEPGYFSFSATVIAHQDPLSCAKADQYQAETSVQLWPESLRICS